MIDIETENTLPAEKCRPATPPRGDVRGATERAQENVSAGEILAEVRRIVDSTDFPASERNRRVLQYILQCRLEGREEEIDAHNIATRVYGRPETFDPLKDPIVRIEMTRLRRDLELYYLKSGAGNPLRIGIPKGRYVPTVTRVLTKGAAPAVDGATASPFLVSVLRASLRAWSGADDAAVAWQDHLLAGPNLLANLQAAVVREVADEEVAGLIVEGVLRAARRST